MCMGVDLWGQPYFEAKSEADGQRNPVTLSYLVARPDKVPYRGYYLERLV